MNSLNHQNASSVTSIITWIFIHAITFITEFYFVLSKTLPLFEVCHVTPDITQYYFEPAIFTRSRPSSAEMAWKLQSTFILSFLLYIVLILSFSDLNFHDVAKPVLQCCFSGSISKIEPIPIKEITSNYSGKHIRKISRESVQTNYSDESFTEQHCIYQELPIDDQCHYKFQIVVFS